MGRLRTKSSLADVVVYCWLDFHVNYHPASVQHHPPKVVSVLPLPPAGWQWPCCGVPGLAAAPPLYRRLLWNPEAWGNGSGRGPDVGRMWAAR
eukprot:gene9286-biopygen16717